ncbi:MAG TPA: SRPBCC family protein [Acidimicrobiia bacterium]|nr:SRPBCC family protein [Acidimicrobiia bacterium]
MDVDVRTQIEIDRDRSTVSGYASELENTTSWYANIDDVEWKTQKPLAVGSKVAFAARFLGRRLVYTYEVREWIPGERLVMSTSEGPFAMETTYEWRDTTSGGTTMTLRNRGTPSGFSKVAAPMMALAMRRANEKDLLRIKSILEAGDPPR